MNGPKRKLSFIEHAAATAVREMPELAVKELVRLIRREAELEAEVARLKEGEMNEDVKRLL